ncbi:MAG TPA: YfiR family protein [Steroidobacteraceae bacterium]
MLWTDSTRRTRIAFAAFAAVCMLGVPAGRAGAAESYSEDAVKAAFLYRFTGYVDWPPTALANPPFTIAVLNADGVAAELGRLLQNRQIHNQAAQVRSIKSIKEINNAQMLYIGAAHREDLRHVVAAMAGRPVLIVTNEADALDAGSTVNFLLIDQRVRFEISVDAAQGAGLKVASELLAVAIRVRGRRVYSEAGCEDAATSAEVTPCIREAAQR